MLARLLAVLASLTGIVTIAYAEETKPAVRIGGEVNLTMTEELAHQYRRLILVRFGQGSSLPNLTIETSAIVAQRLDDRHYRIEHWAPIVEEGKPPRMLTLSAIVKESQLQPAVTKARTPVYDSPASTAKPRLTTEDHHGLRLNLSELHGVTLRTWKLDEEVAK